MSVSPKPNFDVGWCTGGCPCEYDPDGDLCSECWCANEQAALARQVRHS